MRAVCSLILGLFVADAVMARQASLGGRAELDRADARGQFLLQASFEGENGAGFREFRTSRSRIVRFQIEDHVALMRDETEPVAASAWAPVLAHIPLERASSGRVALDLNAGFDRVSLEEDRTGRDYFDPDNREEAVWLPLQDRRVLSLERHGDTIVFDQSASREDGSRLTVHYYLSPYRPAPDFKPFETRNLKRFGFYETYPKSGARRPAFYALHFSANHPIRFLLSAAIPEAYREAVLDGVRYWNRALGRPVIDVGDASPDVRAPGPDANVIDWLPGGTKGSSTHLQADPRTGEIRHAHIFFMQDRTAGLDDDAAADQIRFVMAHEMGHALGLRHNFAAGPDATVMNYLRRPQEVALGRAIRAGAPALPYDRLVIRHVYFGAPLDVDRLPPFCTDVEADCVPFASRDDVR